MTCIVNADTGRGWVTVRTTATMPGTVSDTTYGRRALIGVIPTARGAQHQWYGTRRGRR